MVTTQILAVVAAEARSMSRERCDTWITSALFFNTAQAAGVKADPSAILTIDEDIEEYHREL
jgi:hypothetical protein